MGAVKSGDLAEQNPVGQVYFPYKQFASRDMHIVVKAAQDDAQLTAAVRRELQKADPELALFDVKSTPQRLSSSVGHRRAALVVCLIFAGLALLLSAVGIYGVLAYTVAQRSREFGIRTALGAKAGDVISMVLGHGMRLAAAGLVIGAIRSPGAHPAHEQLTVRGETGRSSAASDLRLGADGRGSSSRVHLVHPCGAHPTRNRTADRVTFPSAVRTA